MSRTPRFIKFEIRHGFFGGGLFELKADTPKRGFLHAENDQFPIWAVGNDIQHWDGTSWTVVTSPNPGTTGAHPLNGVTCASALECWAVGYYVGSSGPQTLIAEFTIALKIISITRLGNGHIVLQCLGLPNQVNDLQASPDLSPGSFATILPPPVAADATGAFPYEDANAGSFTKRFYRLAFP